MDNSHINMCTTQSKDVEPLTQRKDNSDQPIFAHSKMGLLNVRAIIFLLLWYFFSGCTLFLNKYILTYLDGNPAILGKSFFLFLFCVVFICALYTNYKDIFMILPSRVPSKDVKSHSNMNDSVRGRY